MKALRILTPALILAAAGCGGKPTSPSDGGGDSTPIAKQREETSEDPGKHKPPPARTVNPATPIPPQALSGGSGGPGPVPSASSSDGGETLQKTGESLRRVFEGALGGESAETETPAGDSEETPKGSVLRSVGSALGKSLFGGGSTTSPDAQTEGEPASPE